MKKYAGLFVLFLILSSVSRAQVRFGFKGGLNYSYASAQSATGLDLESKGGGGFHLGGQMRVPVDKNLYFVTQAQYAYKTFTVGYYNADTSTIRMKYHYIEIPILLEYNRHADGRGFFFQAGPSFSVAMTANQDIQGKSGNSMNAPVKFGFNAYGRLEANVVANIGYQFTQGMQFTMGYAHGLGTIVDSDFGPTIKPRMVTASLHYWLPARAR